MVGKGKDRRQGKRGWGAAPVSSAPLDPAGRPPGFPNRHFRDKWGCGPGRCPAPGERRVPLAPRGDRRPAIAQGARPGTHPRAHLAPRFPEGRSILTWGTRPAAARALRSPGPAALTRAPPRPGAGPQPSPDDLSSSSLELASPPPGARSRRRPGNPGSPERALPSSTYEATPLYQSEATFPNSRQ